jgi:hypothetical protein
VEVEDFDKNAITLSNRASRKEAKEKAPKKRDKNRNMPVDAETGFTTASEVRKKRAKTVEEKLEERRVAASLDEDERMHLESRWSRQHSGRPVRPVPIDVSTLPVGEPSSSSTRRLAKSKPSTSLREVLNRGKRLATDEDALDDWKSSTYRKFNKKLVHWWYGDRHGENLRPYRSCRTERTTLVESINLSAGSQPPPPVLDLSDAEVFPAAQMELEDPSPPPTPRRVTSTSKGASPRRIPPRTPSLPPVPAVDEGKADNPSPPAPKRTVSKTVSPRRPPSRTPSYRPAQYEPVFDDPDLVLSSDDAQDDGGGGLKQARSSRVFTVPTAEEDDENEENDYYKYYCVRSPTPERVRAEMTAHIEDEYLWGPLMEDEFEEDEDEDAEETVPVSPVRTRPSGAHLADSPVVLLEDDRPMSPPRPSRPPAAVRIDVPSSPPKLDEFSMDFDEFELDEEALGAIDEIAAQAQETWAVAPPVDDETELMPPPPPPKRRRVGPSSSDPADGPSTVSTRAENDKPRQPPSPLVVVAETSPLAFRNGGSTDSPLPAVTQPVCRPGVRHRMVAIDCDDDGSDEMEEDETDMRPPKLTRLRKGAVGAAATTTATTSPKQPQQRVARPRTKKRGAGGRRNKLSMLGNPLLFDVEAGCDGRADGQQPSSSEAYLSENSSDRAFLASEEISEDTDMSTFYRTSLLSQHPAARQFQRLRPPRHHPPDDATRTGRNVVGMGQQPRQADVDPSGDQSQWSLDSFCVDDDAPIEYERSSER